MSNDVNNDVICLTLHKPATHMLFVPALQGVESFTIFWSITKLFSSLRQYSMHGSRFLAMWAVQLCSLLSDNGILSLNDAHCIMRYEGLFGSQGCERWLVLSRWIENREGKESAKGREKGIVNCKVWNSSILLDNFGKNYNWKISCELFWDICNVIYKIERRKYIIYCSITRLE